MAGAEVEMVLVRSWSQTSACLRVVYYGAPLAARLEAGGNAQVAARAVVLGRCQGARCSVVVVGEVAARQARIIVTVAVCQSGLSCHQSLGVVLGEDNNDGGTIARKPL